MEAKIILNYFLFLLFKRFTFKGERPDSVFIVIVFKKYLKYKEII